MEAVEIKDWLAIVLSLLAITGTIYTFLTARADKNSEALAKLHEDHEELAARVAAVETELGHLPTKDMVHAMEVAVARIERDIHAITQAFEGMQRTANRIENHLLKRPVPDAQ